MDGTGARTSGKAAAQHGVAERDGAVGTRGHREEEKRKQRETKKGSEQGGLLPVAMVLGYELPLLNGSENGTLFCVECQRCRWHTRAR